MQKDIQNSVVWPLLINGEDESSSSLTENGRASLVQGASAQGGGQAGNSYQH